MDLYELLGLQRGATLDDIKRSYKRLARRYHPDINPGDHDAEARFKEITRAYETLSDPERRLLYDNGALASVSGAIAFEFEGFDFSGASSQGSPTTFGDLFAEVFTRQEPRPVGAERGADIHATLSLSFDESMAGAQRGLTVTRRDMCHSCRGSGMLRVAAATCRSCEGTGTIRSRRGSLVFSKNCDACGGVGRLDKASCRTCSGLGVEIRSDTITIRIPAGIADGARIRVPEKGNAGPRGGGLGDLFLTVHVAPHDMFRREGDDLHTTAAIGVHEAALGAKIEVPAPDGSARVRVPPGTQSGQRFRVRGRGAPSPRDGQRGDLVVEVRITLPRLLDERSKELLREFGRINGERR